MLIPLSLALLAASSPADAANCDRFISQADQASGAALGTAFGALAQCDKAIAEENYVRFMSRATDADALVALSMAAIEADVWNPVWQQLGKITDYDARDIVAQEVGGACADSEKVIAFLQGAYFGLRDIEFGQWKDAYVACEADALSEWVGQQVGNPPSRQFDDKFDKLMAVFVAKKGAAALSTLSDAAGKAAEIDGPFDAILIKMDEAVAPALGQQISADDKAALEAALVNVAQSVNADLARKVADRLANAGSQEAAAKLLSAVYPDRVQGGGGFLYGGASIELGDCKGTKTAILHVAEVIEPGRRWVIQGDGEQPMRAFKPKLAKCNAEGDAWPVAFTAEPVKSSKDIDPWVSELEKAWADKGYEVKVQSEKDVRLP